MLVYLKFSIQYNPKDLNALAQSNLYIAKAQVRRVVKNRLVCKVDKTRLIYFECYTTLTQLLFGVQDDYILNSFYILFSIITYNLYVKVVDETEGPTITINLLFDEVGIIVNVEKR